MPLWKHKDKVLSIVLVLLCVLKFNKLLLELSVCFIVLHGNQSCCLLDGAELKRSVITGRLGSIAWTAFAALFINLLPIQSFRTFSDCQE